MIDLVRINQETRRQNYKIVQENILDKPIPAGFGYVLLYTTIAITGPTYFFWVLVQVCREKETDPTPLRNIDD